LGILFSSIICTCANQILHVMKIIILKIKCYST
jgi:hypothetical protein